MSRAEDPSRLGEYRILRRLGQGGQGVVYLGESPQGALVAVKLMHARVSGDPDVRRRFLGEVEAVRRVAAFCTAQLLDADLDGDRPYLVSEYVEGPSLAEHVADKGPRSGGSLHRLAIGTATALGAIHRAGVVHRDLKPPNVLLGIDGPRVIDFGVSRMMDAAATTSAGVSLGTPAYLSPERVQGETAGPAADLWAWGLTVAYTATGRHAYRAETYQEVLARILYGKPDLGGLGGVLREVVEGCLRHDPRERPDAEEVLRWLLGHEQGDVLTTGARAAVPVPEPPATTDPRPVRDTDPRSVGGSGVDAWTEPDGGVPSRRRRRWPERQVVVAAVAGLAVAGGVLWWAGEQRPDVAGPPRIVQPMAEPSVSTPAGPDLDGTWTGSAEHPAAKRIFPVELRLSAGGSSSMRWGADLHCSGRLTPGGKALEFRLDRVKGDMCYPGTLRIVPSAADPDQIAIDVTREGQDEVTYSGKVFRGS
ncbi:serine/threonine protein kinase [Nonomuraea sp. PA05]|uniref:serine/threonine protein kinase n=1 Tax=Nonomuraea sp. PA05 TaxID=2604466 RepID=UPI00165243A0|nr:serine/threonine-protein kinase [Nonomuraea sp. PA05]